MVSNPVDVATRSLRTISKDAKLSPATFSRMSTALGYESYDALRDVLRHSMTRQAGSFSSRVEELQKLHQDGGESFFANHLVSCTSNLERLSTSVDVATLELCVERLHNARRVLVAGALGSTGAAEYLTYMASFISDKWSMAHRMGASMASGLVGISDQDVLIVITKPPFAKPTIKAAEEASASGAYVIVITDTHTCPALAFATASFISPTESSHFFSSYASTLVLCEVMIGMLASRAGAPARARIAEVEDRNRTLNEVWDH